MLDLVTGRLRWIRLEPPGEDAIEFRCESEVGQEVHQVKRSRSGGGHWTVGALANVLDDFGAILASDGEVRCVFVSEHAAAELQELSERARSAQDLAEFRARFLDADWLAKPWQQLTSRWTADEDEPFRRLRRVRFTTASEEHLCDDTDAILRLLFDAPPAVSRAALTELALASVHQFLRADDIVSKLAEHGVRRVQPVVSSVVPTTAAPVPSSKVSITRAIELQAIADGLAAGMTTVVVGGISGIGMTTVAAQFAASWKGPVCWLDCALVGSALEALTALSAVLSKAGDDSLASALMRGAAAAEPVGRLAGKCLGARRCLVVWDGVDSDTASFVGPIIEAIGTTIQGGGQLVTQHEHRPRGITQVVVRVGRLEPSAVRTLLVDAFPEARVPDLEAADELTQGHPYLVQLLRSAASSVDLKTALATLPTGGASTRLTSQMLSHLKEDARALLTSLAWLGIPFSAAQALRLGGAPETLRLLADSHLILRWGSEGYRVHDIVAEFVKRSTPEPDVRQYHERSALLLRGLAHPTWVEVRAALAHAEAACLPAIVHETGSALLKYATESGSWALAREAAETLVRDHPDALGGFAQFILGKAARMRGEFAEALTHYARAEELAAQSAYRDMARFERASVLCLLGRRSEADPIYTELAHSEEPATKAEARMGLALGVAERGDLLSAMTTLEEAAEIASTGGAPREEAEAWQCMGVILARAGRWSDARERLQRAHALRYETDARDVYGWFHLYRIVLEVERALGNEAGARAAAHGLWRFAVLSGSLAWECDAAHALCLVHHDANDPEVAMAVLRLRGVGDDSTRAPAERGAALEMLALCEWSLSRHERATEAILELYALSVEHDIDVRQFAYVPHARTRGHENIVILQDDSYGLVLPPQTEFQRFIEELLSSVLSRRPELSKYAMMVQGSLNPAIDSSKRNRKRATNTSTPRAKRGTTKRR